MIRDKELVIRTVEQRDLASLLIWDSPDSRGPYQECRLRSAQQLQREYEDTGFDEKDFKMLILAKEDEPIGLIYVTFVREGLARLGVVICSSQDRGLGYGSRATRMIVNYLFDNYPIVRIEADTDWENQEAQRVLQKVGFIKEGVLRKYRYHHGTWRDSVLYSIVHDET